jgi:hypothetical protein
MITNNPDVFVFVHSYRSRFLNRLQHNRNTRSAAPPHC